MSAGTLVRAAFRTTVLCFAVGFVGLWSTQLGLRGGAWPMLLGLGAGCAMLAGLATAEVVTHIRSLTRPAR